MDRVAIPRLHDAEIIGLCFDAKRAELTFLYRTADGGNQSLTFWGVKAFRVSEFEEQNVVFALTEVAGNVWRESDEGRDEYYQDVATMTGPEDPVYKLESSTGMGGCVVAAGFRLEEAGLWPLGAVTTLPAS